MDGKDYISELEELAFASRLRRLSERLGRDVGKIYADLQLPFKAKWFPLFSLLSRHTSLSVTESASRLGLSHAGINQLAAQMEKAGLVEGQKSSADERRRLLCLSDKGQKQLKILEPVWEIIRNETALLLKSVDPEFLNQIQNLEESLDALTMHERVMNSLEVPIDRKVEILEYRPAYKKYFKSINEEWLKTQVGVEAEDRRQLNDPNGQIIRKGGEILFAKMDGEVVGTCALIYHNENVLELSKMGVTVGARGLGIGRLLAENMVALARSFGAEYLYLLTAPELKAAIRLYQSLGFRRKKRTPLSAKKYKRCTVAMELKL
ncbi:MAG: bifunctional helix-turn-helix transcriptional regulator/GNAT family N-acetyltransferase [bacterium]|nr:bifunctional helix-turn-helix transcriptional regulator/GNAT family N-acetyltransferase [bacterium]